MKSRLGCFQQGTCIDIGTQEDNPGLSAALCDNNNHTDLCECCEEEGWPPACASWRTRCTAIQPPTPDSPAPSADEIRISVNDSACDIVNAWRPNAALQCSKTLAQKAADRLRAGFSSDTCTMLAAPALPGNYSEIISCGEHVGTCSWPDTMASWLQAQEADSHPGHALLAAGAVHIGCAEASVGQTGNRDPCAARLCLISPALDVPAYIPLPPDAQLSTCSSACLGVEAGCAGLPDT